MFYDLLLTNFVYVLPLRIVFIVYQAKNTHIVNKWINLKTCRWCCF